ncbi:MAG: pyridoxal 5'-phosphate synthase lyase subunit PdxS [Bacillales bacterium]|jgi:pyridoxal 5'-phosphate synthase pdxS subunit|nr:pyridoxal 5'-phosphate synthase lyase subunit PdxS [Bacillales bacterium]
MNREKINKDLAIMLKNGVIMDVTNVSEAKIAQEAGAVAVMALERVPSDIRKEGGVARMSDPQMIKEIQKAVSIPVMAKVRIGHLAEANILQALDIDFIDESEVLTPADEDFHINKKDYKVPFVCGARDLSEALRRINEGASMIRTKGEAGTGNIVEAVRHQRKIKKEISDLLKMNDYNLKAYAESVKVPLELVIKVKEEQKLPVVNFAAGGIATPADAALMMLLGSEGVFVGSGIFKSSNPLLMAKAIVEAVNNYQNSAKLALISEGLGQAMKGLDIKTIPNEELLAKRGK